jgi:uncharacterized protein with HEPN domain
MKPAEQFSMFFVQEILDNCVMIQTRISQYSMTKESYAKSTLYQDILTMPMIRICEIIKLYRPNFEQLHPNYNWKAVGAMRDKMAHPYGGFDYEFVWDAAVENIPELQKIAQQLIDDNLS